jgi:hypothetical protein
LEEYENLNRQTIITNFFEYSLSNNALTNQVKSSCGWGKSHPKLDPNVTILTAQKMLHNNAVVNGIFCRMVDGGKHQEGILHRHTVLSILIVLAILTMPFGSRADAARSVRMDNASGAFAIFEEWDSSGCISTLLLVDFSQNKAHFPPGGSNEATLTTLYSNQWNACTRQMLRSAFILGAASGLDFQVDPSLKSARAVLETQMYDLVTNSMIDVTLDMVWTGNGGRKNQVVHNRYDTPECKYHTTTRGAFRGGSITGKVEIAGQQMTNYRAGGEPQLYTFAVKTAECR